MCSGMDQVKSEAVSRPEVFYKKDVPRNFTKFTGKHLSQSLFFNKVAGLRMVKHTQTIRRQQSTNCLSVFDHFEACNFIKLKRLWHRCFPVNIVRFLGTPFYMEHLWWLLLLNLVKIASKNLT